MKEYFVRMPMTGIIGVTIQAENEEEAIRIAFEETDITTDDIEEFDWVEKVVQGNVFYGVLNEVFVEDHGEVK